MGTAESSMSFVTSYPHGHNSWSNLYAGHNNTVSAAGGVGYFYPQAGTGYGFDRMGSAQTNAYGPSLGGLRTWQEAEAKHLKDGEEYRLKKYNEVKSMHDGYKESKRMSGESSAVSLTPLAVLMATATLDTPDMAPVLAVPLATAAPQTSLFRDTVTQWTASRVWATLTVIR